MSNVEYIPVGLNGIFSLAIIFVCICRLAAIRDRVLLRVSTQYVVMVMAAAANGASPWLFDMPGWPSVVFSVAVLYMLVADSYQWRNGPPECASSPAPLSES
jgi:hypothetical protein